MDNLLQTLLGRVQPKPSGPSIGPAIPGSALPAPDNMSIMKGQLPMPAEFVPVGGEAMANAGRAIGGAVSKVGTLPKFAMGPQTATDPRIAAAVGAAKTPFAKLQEAGAFSGSRLNTGFKEGAGGLSEMLPLLLQRLKGGQ